MIDDILLDSTISTVPQWYCAEYGLHRHSLSVGKSRRDYYSHHPLTPSLKALHLHAQTLLKRMKAALPDRPLPGLGEILQGELAFEWLRLNDPYVDWLRLLSYLKVLKNRSYENAPISLNLVIGEGKGTIDITRQDLLRFIDPLANSPQVFFRIDKSLRYVSYEEIPWSIIRETELYKFNPEFLQPFASILKKGEYSIHLTQAGDLIFLNSMGIVASNRKGFWHLYDVHNFTKSIADILGNHSMACMLSEVLLDLSYYRRGALLVYDPENKVIQNVVNKGSCISKEHGDPDLLRSMLAGSFKDVRTDDKKLPARRKRLFIEIANIDGAVIFNSRSLLAFGAMIKPHPAVESKGGARTTAAESAYRWGGIPAKVSADGYISILFKSIDGGRNSCGAELSFL
jgi:hypothetical protein